MASHPWRLRSLDPIFGLSMRRSWVKVLKVCKMRWVIFLCLQDIVFQKGGVEEVVVGLILW